MIPAVIVDTDVVSLVTHNRSDFADITGLTVISEA
jgi:hypothetical protein